MKPENCILQYRESMLSAWTRTGAAAGPEKTCGGGTTAGAAAGEDFADVITLAKAGTGMEEATEASESERLSDKANAEGAGLMAVLEKLAARSALRPEVRGLQNAAERIRENLERRGIAAPSSPPAEEGQPIESPVTGNDPTEEFQAVAESAEDGAGDTIPPVPATLSDGFHPEMMEEPFSMIAENLTAFVSEEE